MWTFVGKKQARLAEDDPADLGDQFVFVSLGADTKLVLSYLVGKRTLACAKEHMSDLRSRIIGRPQITTDGFAPYVEAVEYAFGADVEYAMIVGKEDHAGGAASITPGERRIISGAPDPTRISTSYVERFNLTTRMQLRRTARSTNAFSKRLPNLEAAFALQFGWYNFCRVHETLRVTPAMQAGLTATIWSTAELVSRATEAHGVRADGRREASLQIPN